MESYTLLGPTRSLLLLLTQEPTTSSMIVASPIRILPSGLYVIPRSIPYPLWYVLSKIPMISRHVTINASQRLHYIDVTPVWQSVMKLWWKGVCVCKKVVLLISITKVLTSSRLPTVVSDRIQSCNVYYASTVYLLIDEERRVVRAQYTIASRKYVRFSNHWPFYSREIDHIVVEMLHILSM